MKQGTIRVGKRRREQPFWIALGMGLIFLGWGCGYHFSAGGAPPSGVSTVFLAPLSNRSTDVGVDKELEAALSGEFRRWGALRVVERVEDADAVLSGVVRTLDARVVGVNDNDEALLYEMELVVTMTLRRRSPDEVLWSTRGFRLTERYSGSRGSVVTTSSAFKRGGLNESNLFSFTDIQLTETLRQQARTKLIDKFAQETYQQIMERF